MRMSTKVRYGFRFLLDLAANGKQSVVTLREASERQNISQKYLWQVVAPLKAEGMIATARGKKGGFYLVKSPDEISLLDVYQTLEGSTNMVNCVDEPGVCDRSETCEVREMWDTIGTGLGALMKDITVGAILRKQKAREKKKTIDYSI